MKLGMYVRCPFDENSNSARTFYMGQIEKIDDVSDEATIKLYDPYLLRSFFKFVPEKIVLPCKLLMRVSPIINSIVFFKGFRVKIISISKEGNKDDYYNYYVEYFKDGNLVIGEVSETQIIIPFNISDCNPANQILNYELHNPQWYLNRRVVSKSLNSIANAPYGFKNLLGTRVHLFKHQVDTIVRALSENPCRLMLADEVGLGKTIEALAIIKGMIDKKPNLKSLIIVPDTLIYQWQNELTFKFWIEAPIWGRDNICSDKLLIVSSNDVVRDFKQILEIHKWDICIVDETHRLLYNKELYEVVLNICRDTSNILLLSATPILNMEQEYSKLLTLLNPVRFEHMPAKELAELLKKQKKIQNVVYNLMRDIPDYLEFDLHDDFITSLIEINEEINDGKLGTLISEINIDEKDKGLSHIKLILAYIAEFYQIERGIIRHRRVELESIDIKRKLIKITYEMAGSDIGFYEENCYNSVMELAELLIRDFDNNKLNLVKKLIMAVSSSPYAVLDVLEKNNETFKIFHCKDVLMYAKKWKKAYDEEIENIKNVNECVDDFYSKFSKIIDHIDQCDIECNKKYIIFTEFVSTAIKLEECFKIFFGQDSTCSFHKGMTPEDMHEAATLFQNDSRCRFIVCDESGGEGRNFQIADYIIHCDLPWSPATLEQRIGRLDRIGRINGKDVISIVIHSTGSVENYLFNIYNKGLNLFNESLCGMEIAFEQIHNTIENSLKRDVRFGLIDCINEIQNFLIHINDEIEKERYFDMARQLDIDLQEKLNNLIFQFTNDDGKELMNTMMAWPHMVGFMGIKISDVFSDNSKVISIDINDLNVRSMENVLYFPPSMDEIIKRSKYKNDIRGTFSRSSAVKHENLTFFAPYNSLFDSITKNAEECYKGRSTAFKYNNSTFKWRGLLFTWNVRFNPKMIFRNNYSNELVSLISRYLMNDQVFFSKGTNKNYDNINAVEIIDEIERFERRRPIHLGKRGDGSIEEFIKRYPPEIWKKYVNSSYKVGRSYAAKQAKTYINKNKAKEELETALTVSHVRELFYGYLDNNILLKDSEQIDAIIYGLDNPIIELDSVAFIMLEK